MRMALELQELDTFLASIERRAYQMAMVSVGNREDALDVVQEAMAQLAQKYSQKDPDQWRPIFYRILQNRALDLHRKRKLQKRIMGWFSSENKSDISNHEENIIEQAPAAESGSPHAQHQQGRTIEAITAALVRLPHRQQQAFMLRCWEGMSTAESAIAMKCSEGSVKTHYSRALHRLRTHLGGDLNESI